MDATCTPVLTGNPTSPVAAASLDLEACLVAACDARPWHDRDEGLPRACTGLDSELFTGDAPPPAFAIDICHTCPARERCVIEGLRLRMDDMLAESPDEISGYFGGLSPAELWEVAQELRAEAAKRGLRIRDAIVCIDESVRRFAADGWSIADMAGELGVAVIVIEDAIVGLCDAAGWSNRRIAEVLEGRSYKWVERRRKLIAQRNALAVAA